MQKQMHEKAGMLIVNGKYQVGSELFHSLDCVTLHTVPDEKLNTSKEREEEELQFNAGQMDG